MSTLDIRVMTDTDLAAALDMAAAEGWNPGLNDAACLPVADPTGFLIGCLDGKPVASISVVRYGADKGFLGFYITKPEIRGQGHGLAIWNAGMKYLQGRNVGLDGVPDQQDNYRKSGYTLAFRNIRYAGTGGGGAPDGLMPLNDVPFEQVLAYDAAMFTAARPEFLKTWIAQPGAAALAALDDGRLAGFAVARPCREGFKVGPLFADDEATAERLFAGVTAPAAGQPVFLDVPETNAAAVRLAERHDMAPSFETARMYTGPAWPIPLDRLFGITTFELG
ncbi:MAG: GNAT family N-acetyltransferase [Alphaproteobacteria bacterium]